MNHAIINTLVEQLNAVREALEKMRLAVESIEVKPELPASNVPRMDMVAIRNALLDDTAFIDKLAPLVKDHLELSTSDIENFDDAVESAVSDAVADADLSDAVTKAVQNLTFEAETTVTVR